VHDGAAHGGHWYGLILDRLDDLVELAGGHAVEWARDLVRRQP